jgi:hypothetical protein
MATFYLDPDSGNDANNGTSFALAWKTFKSGATAARIAPGDTIRIKASPLPTSLGVNGTFTKGSDTITLASAVTANVDLCETAWTASANVTCNTSTTRREGSFSCSFAIAGAFTTGLVAYKDLGSNIDFSAYSQLSFAIWSTAIATKRTAGAWQIKLCSDAAGATPVDTIDIPEWGGTSRANVIAAARNGGGTFGSASRSIALYAVNDPGADTLFLDNILACKDSSSADSLTLRSLIGINDGSGRWYGIKSINGTTIKIEGNSGAINTTATRGYSGATVTTTAYKREAFLIPVSDTDGTLGNQINDSGTEGSDITFSGGWNRTDMSSQLTGDDAQSWFDGNNTLQFGLAINSQNYLTFENISHVRCDYGIYSGASGNYIKFTKCHAIHNRREGAGMTSSFLRLTSCILSNNTQSGFVTATAQNIILDSCTLDSNGTVGLNLSTTGSRLRTINTTMKNNGTYGVATSRGDSEHYGATMSDNGSGSVNNTGYTTRFFNSLFGDATEVNHVLDYSNWPVYSTKHDQTIDTHRTFIDGALISSETGANRRTLDGIGWSIAVTSALRNSLNPAVLPVCRIACVANEEVTVSIWAKRTNTGLTGKLVCRGAQIAGVASDVSASMAGAAGSYEEVSISFTPTEAGVVEVEFQAYGGTTYTVYLDDMTIEQA